MRPELLVFLILALVAAAMAGRSQGKRERPAWAGSLGGLQRPFVFIAVLATMLMMLNPEFVALGLFSDAAFFDMVVLALSLQMHSLFIRACRGLMAGVVSWMRLLCLPGLGDRYLFLVASEAFENALTALRKLYRRAFRHWRLSRLAI